MSLILQEKPRINGSRFTLSEFYPSESVYFYSFPAGEASKFYNQVPTVDEELVSGRPLVCAGSSVKVVTFASCSEEYILDMVSQGLDVTDRDNIISLPKIISSGITGRQRNSMVKEALIDLVDDDRLVMAQPFLDDSLLSKFRINPSFCVNLSDKTNKQLYIPKKYLPKEYAVLDNGVGLLAYGGVMPLPCVIKVASSSSGDGVRICLTTKDVDDARSAFSQVGSTIIIEEYIDIEHNLCIQFGISHNQEEKPVIIGFNEQLTGKQGEFFGGIVNPWKSIPFLDDINGVLEKEVLPRLRDLGWYGIGGIDVLIRADGRFYFIDPNLRMTATYAYVYLVKTGQINQPLISFSGKIMCSREEFEKYILPFSKGDDAILKIISITNNDENFRFNAGILFDSVPDLQKKATMFLGLGIKSNVLDNVVKHDFEYDLL